MDDVKRLLSTLGLAIPQRVVKELLAAASDGGGSSSSSRPSSEKLFYRDLTEVLIKE